ncbi:MAG: hypothetical protein HY537_06995 [Deltaproteobacteria bacterium]|nr:hypothetical protein [Deltaproteobacteria bacterium]
MQRYLLKNNSVRNGGAMGRRLLLIPLILLATQLNRSAWADLVPSHLSQVSTLSPMPRAVAEGAVNLSDEQISQLPGYELFKFKLELDRFGNQPRSRESIAALKELEKRIRLYQPYAELFGYNGLMPEQVIQRLDLRDGQPERWLTPEGVAWALIGVKDIRKFYQDAQTLRGQYPNDYLLHVLASSAKLLTKYEWLKTKGKLKTNQDRKKFLDSLRNEPDGLEYRAAITLLNQYIDRKQENSKRVELLNKIVIKDTKGNFFIRPGMTEAAKAYTMGDYHTLDWYRARADDSIEQKALFLFQQKDPFGNFVFVAPNPANLRFSGQYKQIRTRKGLFPMNGMLGIKDPLHDVDFMLVGNSPGDNGAQDGFRSMARIKKISFASITSVKNGLAALKKWAQRHPEKTEVVLAIGDHGAPSYQAFGGGGGGSATQNLSPSRGMSAGLRMFVNGLKDLPFAVKGVKLMGCSVGGGPRDPKHTHLQAVLAREIGKNNVRYHNYLGDVKVTAWTRTNYTTPGSRHYFATDFGGLQREVTWTPQLHMINTPIDSVIRLQGPLASEPMS